MIFIPNLTAKWGFDVGVKAGQSAGGVVVEETKTLVNNVTTGLKNIGSNFIVMLLIGLVIFIVILKVVNRLTK